MQSSNHASTGGEFEQTEEEDPNEDSLLNIHKEIELLHEIKDIRDEIHILSELLKDQQAVVSQLSKGRETKLMADLTKLIEHTRNRLKSMDKYSETTRYAVNTIFGIFRVGRLTFHRLVLFWI